MLSATSVPEQSKFLKIISFRLWNSRQGSRAYSSDRPTTPELLSTTSQHSVRNTAHSKQITQHAKRRSGSSESRDDDVGSSKTQSVESSTTLSLKKTNDASEPKEWLLIYYPLVARNSVETPFL